MTPISKLLQKKLSRKLTVLSVAVLLTLCTSALLLDAHRAGLLRVSAHQQPFTELYFTSPQTLPAQASAKQSFPLVFTLENHEGDTLTYRYVIQASDGNTATRLATGTAVVPEGTSIDTRVTLRLPASSQPVLISVSLEGKPHTIQFRTSAQ